MQRFRFSGITSSVSLDLVQMLMLLCPTPSCHRAAEAFQVSKKIQYSVKSYPSHPSVTFGGSVREKRSTSLDRKASPFCFCGLFDGPSGDVKQGGGGGRGGGRSLMKQLPLTVCWFVLMGFLTSLTLRLHSLHKTTTAAAAGRPGGFNSLRCQ